MSFDDQMTIFDADSKPMSIHVTGEVTFKPSLGGFQFDGNGSDGRMYTLSGTISTPVAIDISSCPALMHFDDPKQISGFHKFKGTVGIGSTDITIEGGADLKILFPLNVPESFEGVILGDAIC
jgi:hypothetical protein